jgi:hypothetical protein
LELRIRVDTRTRGKLAKLRNITVARGATPGEEAAAKAAIARMMECGAYDKGAAMDEDVAHILDLLQRSMSVPITRAAVWVAAAVWMWAWAANKART